MEPDRRRSLIAALSSLDEEEKRSAMEKLKVDLSEADLEWLIIPMSDDSWRVRKEAIEGLASLTPSETLIAELIPLMDPTRELTLRNSVVEVLEGMGNEATPFLIRHLHVDQPDTRKFLVDILGNIADISTIPSLVQLLGDDENNIRAAAAEALASVGDPSVSGALLDALVDAEEWVVFSILGALDKLRCPDALPVFFKYLNNQVLAKPSLSGIGTMGDLSDGVKLMGMVNELSRGAAKASFPAVGAIFRNHVASKGFPATRELRKVVSEAAEESMVDFLAGQLSVSDQLEKKQDLLAVLGMVGTEKALDAILQYVDDDSLEREVSLAILTTGAAHPALISGLLEHYDPLVRRKAVQALEQLGDRSSLESLSGKLKDESGHVRKDAARAVSRIGDSRSIPSLLPLLEDEYSDVAQTAAQALVVLGQGDPDTLSTALKPLQEGSDPSVRSLLLKIMTEVQTSDWQEICMRSIHDEEAVVRAAAVNCLKRSEDPNAVRVVINSLTDEQPEVRVQAAISLEELKPDEALSPLKATLYDKDPWVKTAAISSLSAQPGSVPGDFAELLEGEDLMIQTSVIDALGAMAVSGKEGAIEMLDTIFSDGTVETRRSVCRILGRIDDSRAFELLIKAVKDEDPGIRTFAAHSLAEKGGDSSRTILVEMAQNDTDRGVREAVRTLVETF